MLRDGSPLEIGGTRQRSVLALLLLQRNRALSTELLADRLWPDDAPLTAVKTIQVYVSRLRRALGPDAGRLASSSSGYRLTVTDDELDAARFERGLRLAREGLATRLPETSLTAFEEVLELWSGPALGDLATEPFARREAERLEELRLQAVEELLELRIDTGLGRETIGELRRLLGDNPGRERLWRLLMLALYGDGRQGEALQAYQDARRYLGEELGLDPGPELAALERAILTQEAPQPSQTRLVANASPGSASDKARPTSVSTEPIGRRRRIVTVLRADVSRPVSEHDLDPEVIEEESRRVLDVVRRAVERHGGIVDHSDHDGVTAVFGFTAAREDDALRTIRAAVELIGVTRSTDELDAVVLQIGVATGEVLMGSGETGGSLFAGVPLKVASSLAARAAPNEVLLAPETEKLVRWTATTEAAPAVGSEGTRADFPVRLVAFADGEAITRRADTLFVGRRAELEALFAAYDRVESDGRPGIVTIVGAPGVGKSRLVAEFFAPIGDRATVLRSRCLSYGDGITYWPVRDLVLAASGVVTGDARDVAVAKLERIVGGLDRADVVRSRIASVVGLTDDPVPSDEIPWTVRRFFEALAVERPVVLLVDDLQWAEPALLDLLEHVVDLGRGRILLITVARPEIEERRPDWLARSRLLLRLDSLDDTDSSVLLDHLAPELRSGELRSTILSASGGSPLFVEQFVAYLSDQATRERRRGARTTSDLPVPPTIGALLAARLDRLPETERTVLERAAVMGRTFWEGALADLLPDEDRADLARTLGQLVRRDLIRPDRSDLRDQEAYRFRHLLIRDTAYGALPKRERARLHERFAVWLANHLGDDPGEYGLILGYHFEQAYLYRAELGDRAADIRALADRALALIGPAGQAALERGDAHAAAALLRRAVGLSPAPGQRVALLLDIRRALWNGGELGASDAADAEAAALLAAHPDEGLEHRRRLNEWLITGFDINAGQAAFEYYERVADQGGMLRALQVMASHNANIGKFTVSLELVDQATELALEIGGPDLAGKVSAEHAWILRDCPVGLPDALDRLRRYLDLTGENRESRAVILLVIGELEARSGVRDTWRRHFDTAKGIIDDLGLLFQGIANYPSFLGDAELAAGEPGHSLDILRRSCSTLDRLGNPGFLSMIAPLTAQTLLEIGEFDEVEHYALWGRDVAKADDIDAQRRWRIGLSGLRSQQGRHDEAITLARESVEFVRDTDWTYSLGLAHLALAGALQAAGDDLGAREQASEAQRLASATQDRSTLRRAAVFLEGVADRS